MPPPKQRRQVKSTSPTSYKIMSGVKDKRKKMKSFAEKKRHKDKAQVIDQFGDKEKNCENKISRKKKQRKSQMAEHETVAASDVYTEDGSGEENQVAKRGRDDENRKLRKKKKKNEKKADLEQQNERRTLSEMQVENESHEVHNETDTGMNVRTSKSRKARKKKNQLKVSVEDENLSENRVSIEDDIYQISSGDEDCSKGMRKWITECHQKRPGLNVLQESIDDFITEHEARVEQERKEREAKAAEEGWTVVVHHKGRKKTTDAESGVVVGSVAQATALDKMTKKKDKQVGLDFYRFQKREAKRSEIMMLQSKFEQDKKRIQQMRAARKFRPY